ncbi:MAG: hypothetical protein R2839_00700 [Thermomicrobiales bacterium]
MSNLSADYHYHRGRRLFEQHDWDGAARELRSAIREGGAIFHSDVMAVWARATLCSTLTWDRKITALISESGVGYGNPEFWTLALRAYFQALDQYDGRQSSLSPSAKQLITGLREHVAECIEVGTGRFASLVRAGTKDAYAWGIALVLTGDWIYDYQRAGYENTDRYPFRPIAETLNRPVAYADFSRLFDDPKTRDDIERSLTNRARMQLHRMGPTVRPSRSARSRLDASVGQLFALRSMR